MRFFPTITYLLFLFSLDSSNFEDSLQIVFHYLYFCIVAWGGVTPHDKPIPFLRYNRTIYFSIRVVVQLKIKEL